MDEKLFISEKLREINLEPSSEKIEQMYDFYEMVLEKNKVMNLTAITDFKDFVIKHFIDSLLISKVVLFDEIHTLLDVGTGAGFPGMPLKIMFPHVEVLLLDSLNKRLVFLDDVIEKLGLHGISTIHTRAEELQTKGAYRENFDLVVSRAVSALPSLLEYCLPYVKLGGNFVAYKATNAREELDLSKKALSVLGGRVKEMQSFRLEENDRVLISVEKSKSTPSKYPRGGGKPTKNPL